MHCTLKQTAQWRNFYTYSRYRNRIRSVNVLFKWSNNYAEENKPILNVREVITQQKEVISAPKGHEECSEIDGELQKQSRRPVAKAALDIVSSPEGCNMFLLSLLAVLISLHVSWMKIEFVWTRGRCYWLRDRARARVSARTRGTRAPARCLHESQPIHNSNVVCVCVCLSYIIVNAAHLCSAALFNGRDPDSGVHRRPPASPLSPFGLWHL